MDLERAGGRQFSERLYKKDEALRRELQLGQKRAIEDEDARKGGMSRKGRIVRAERLRRQPHRLRLRRHDSRNRSSFPLGPVRATQFDWLVDRT